MALEFKCGSDGAGDNGVDVSRGVDKVVVLAATLADQFGESSVVVEVLAYSLPQPLEGAAKKSVLFVFDSNRWLGILNLRNGSCKVDGRQFRMRRDGFAKDRAVGRNKVDDAVGESGVTEDLVNQVVGQNGCVTGLPDNAVALILEKKERMRDKKFLSAKRICPPRLFNDELWE